MSDPIRVLVVDEDQDVRDLTGTFLERVDDAITVEMADGGVEAIEAVERGDVDAVVSDFHMPGMDGVDLAREIADRDVDVPFVLFSAVDDDALAEANADEAVDAAVRKRTGTEHYEDLVSEIRAALDARSGD